MISFLSKEIFINLAVFDKEKRIKSQGVCYESQRGLTAKYL